MRGLISHLVIAAGVLASAGTAGAYPAAGGLQMIVSERAATAVAWRTVCDRYGDDCRRVWVDRYDDEYEDESVYVAQPVPRVRGYDGRDRGYGYGDRAREAEFARQRGYAAEQGRARAAPPPVYTPQRPVVVQQPRSVIIQQPRGGPPPERTGGQER